MFELLIRKRIYFFFLILFFSCSNHHRQWEVSTIQAMFPCKLYAKARFPADNTFNGLDIELLGNKKHSTFFLNALTLCFPNIDSAEGWINVNFLVNDQEYQFICDKLEGSQRIKLPEEAKQLLISSLLEKNFITIFVGAYQTTILPDNFESIYYSFFND